MVLTVPVEHNDSEFRRIMRFWPNVFEDLPYVFLVKTLFRRKTHFGAKMKLISTFLAGALAGVQYIPAVNKADETCM